MWTSTRTTRAEAISPEKSFFRREREREREGKKLVVDGKLMAMAGWEQFCTLDSAEWMTGSGQRVEMAKRRKAV